MISSACMSPHSGPAQQKILLPSSYLERFKLLQMDVIIQNAGVTSIAIYIWNVNMQILTLLLLLMLHVRGLASHAWNTPKLT